MEQNRVALRNVHLGHDPLPPFEKKFALRGIKTTVEPRGVQYSSLEIKTI